MTEKEFNMFGELFSTDGWIKMMQDLQEMRDATLESAPMACQMNEQWQYCRGQLQQMDTMLNMQIFIEAQWKQQKEEEAAAEEDDEDVDIV